MVLILLLPVPQAIAAATISKVGAEIWLVSTKGTPTAWQKPVVNCGGTVLAVSAAAWVFHGLGGGTVLWGHGPIVWAAFPVLAATIVTYHETNVLAIVGAITILSKEMPWSVFARVTWGTFFPELAIMLAGILFSVIWHYNPPLSLLTAAPLFLSLRAFQALHRLREGTSRAVTQMAKIIEFRDTGTHEHSDTLVRLSGRLAQRAGLIPDHVEDVMLGAGVHDLGKIGIGNDILLKRGPLTTEEQERMREHPIIGETILSGYENSPFQGCLKIVRHHHERWDGTGYPDGLKGEAIPIGARIITIVDSYDAMTSDRPYRRGMPVEEAVARLEAGMGTQFDPGLTQLFIQMLEEDGVLVPQGVRSAELWVATGQLG
jgi:HD-GYP domain-containing protein (c-di-GMP phosphodiesterase class II)